MVLTAAAIQLILVGYKENKGVDKAFKNTFQQEN